MPNHPNKTMYSRVSEHTQRYIDTIWLQTHFLSFRSHVLSAKQSINYPDELEKGTYISNIIWISKNMDAA